MEKQKDLGIGTPAYENRKKSAQDFCTALNSDAELNAGFRAMLAMMLLQKLRDAKISHPDLEVITKQAADNALQYLETV